MINIKLNYELKCGYPVISIEHHPDNEPDKRLLVIYRKSIKGSSISTCYVNNEGGGVLMMLMS
ncbi:MAG: hypothetical protein COA78_22080 [Blastopirellula sp.]|nr:MAG: hypothetical protein COA78_22080 [Blastopirellula sp.]